MLLVMVIIGLRASYFGPKRFAKIGKSESKVTLAQIDALQKALDHCRIDIGRYPATDAGLAALAKRQTKHLGTGLHLLHPPLAATMPR